MEEEDDKGYPMIRIGVSQWVFLLVPAYPGCPAPKAVKRLCVCGGGILNRQSTAECVTSLLTLTCDLLHRSLQLGRWQGGSWCRRQWRWDRRDPHGAEEEAGRTARAEPPERHHAAASPQAGQWRVAETGTEEENGSCRCWGERPSFAHSNELLYVIQRDHTHTHLTALCPGLPAWAGTRKVKPIWILLKQQTVSGSGISWAICKSAPRSRQITMPAPHCSVTQSNHLSRKHGNVMQLTNCLGKVGGSVQRKVLLWKTVYRLFIVSGFRAQVWCAFSALTLLVGRQEEHPTCKNWVMRCWCGYLSGARCRLFAYGPADASTVPIISCLS